MFFEFKNRNKTIKQLRKDQQFTTKELALKINVEHIDILHIDGFKLKEIKEPLRSKLLPILRGDLLNRI